MQIYTAMQVLAEFDVIFRALYTNELVFNRVGSGCVNFLLLVGD